MFTKLPGQLCNNLSSCSLGSALDLQQSVETCAVLDTLIVNSIDLVLGNCTRNNLCTAINCVNIFEPTSIQMIDITFSPCSNPISVRYLYKFELGGQEFVLLDSTVTEDMSASIETNNVTILFNQTDNGVSFGVSYICCLVNPLPQILSKITRPKWGGGVGGGMLLA